MSDGELRNMTCIGCPLGCRLAVEHHGDMAWATTGYLCKKGKSYGVQEATDPRRMVTTTVAIEGAMWSRLPVRTVGEVPKERVAEVCLALHRLVAQAPVEMGDVIMADVLGTGVDVVASRGLALTKAQELR